MNTVDFWGEPLCTAHGIFSSSTRDQTQAFNSESTSLTMNHKKFLQLIIHMYTYIFCKEDREREAEKKFQRNNGEIFPKLCERHKFTDSGSSENPKQHKFKGNHI